MSLIDRYIAEVGRHLPEKNRADIEAEIRSTLEDMIEERGGQTAKSPDVKIIAETLEQMGDPKLLASSYSQPKLFLIGPDWYEFYVKVLQRVLVTVLPIFATVTFIITLTENPLDFINAVGEAVGGAFSVGLQILFWVTVVFVFLDRSDEVSPSELPRQNKRIWTVAHLPQLPKTRQISIVETMTNIVFVGFALAWVVLPPFFGRFQTDGGFVSLFHPNLQSVWLPIFFVIVGFTLIHELFKLKIGNWTPALTMTNVILGSVAIVYIIALVTTQELLNPVFLATLTESVAAEDLRNLAISARWTINITAAVIVGIYIWDMVDSVRKSKVFEKQNTRAGYSYTEM